MKTLKLFLLPLIASFALASCMGCNGASKQCMEGTNGKSKCCCESENQCECTKCKKQCKDK